MTPHRALNLLLTAIGTLVLTVIMSTSHLLDGPSELDALQDTQASVIDAQHDAQRAAQLASATSEVAP